VLERVEKSKIKPFAYSTAKATADVSALLNKQLAEQPSNM
jgi:hypothetical protein